MYERRIHSGRPESREGRHELRRMKQRRSDRVMLMIIILGPICLYFGYEIARSVYYLHDVQSFTSTLSHRTTPEIKADLDRYVPLLLDRNTVVRDAAMAAFKAATGWNPGADGIEWKHMWLENESYWQYHPYQPPQPPHEAPWAAALPPSVLHTGAAPTAIPAPEP